MAIKRLISPSKQHTMQQKSSSGSEHPDSPNMHHNEAYGYTDPAQLSIAPLFQTEMTVCSDQVNVGAPPIHTEPEYSSIDVPVPRKSHQVATRTRSYAGVNHPAGSQKMQKRFSIDYNKLEHHTGTQPLDAIHSTLGQETTTVDQTTTSTMEQKLVSRVDVVDSATLPSMQPTCTQDELSELSLPLHKGAYNQEQSCHEEALTTFGERGSIEQEKKMSIPKVLVDQELSDDSNQQSKMIK